jgi:hypothetical protein
VDKEARKQQTQVVFRPPQKLHQLLKERARRNRRTMGAEVELLVIDALAAKGEIQPETV